MKSLIVVAISSLAILLPSPLAGAVIHKDTTNVGYAKLYTQKTLHIYTASIQRPLKPIAVLASASVVKSLKTGVYSPNTYFWGQCVWYVKERRPELPNTWHDATDWLYHAKADGWPTGTTPRVGAVGWVYGHVVYIERVNPDNTVYFSEMNVLGVGVKSYRTKPASYFTYIY